jgi:hypothetical protein
MNRIHHVGRIRRPAGILALASAVLASTTAAPGAFASTSPGSTRPAGLTPEHLPPLPPGWNKHPPLPDPTRIHAPLAGGPPGWQITLIAVAAVLLAAALAVSIYRIRAVRRRVSASAA